MRTSRARAIIGSILLLALGATPTAAQPPVRLADGARPPTRVIPGDEIEMTVFDPTLFPSDGAWTIGGRRVTPVSGAAGTDAYRLAFGVPADFPSAWDRLPIVYADPAGRVLYDSRSSDARDAVALADIADPAPFLAGNARVTGATGLATRGDRVCVCGLFPNRRSWDALRVGGAPLGTLVTGSATELWFEIPAELAPGIHEITGDPAAGFTAGDRAPIEILDPTEGGAEGQATTCPCAGSSRFLSAWQQGRTMILERTDEEQNREPVRGAPVDRPADARPARTAETAGPPPGTLLWIESLGGSTGEVFKVHVVSPGSEPVSFHGYAAIEPLAIPPEERARLVARIQDAPGTHQELTANFYCLEFLRQAPTAGIVYRIAEAAKQERFGPAARALDAARRLQEQGLLNPDSNPESYFHSIRQWAVWTLEQGFDREKFLDAFLEHAEKNLARAGRGWSEEVEAAVLRSAEGRWQDITEVLAEAR